MSAVALASSDDVQDALTEVERATADGHYDCDSTAAITFAHVSAVVSYSDASHR